MLASIKEWGYQCTLQLVVGIINSPRLGMEYWDTWYASVRLEAKICLGAVVIVHGIEGIGLMQPGNGECP